MLSTEAESWTSPTGRFLERNCPGPSSLTCVPSGSSKSTWLRLMVVRHLPLAPLCEHTEVEPTLLEFNSINTLRPKFTINFRKDPPDIVPTDFGLRSSEKEQGGSRERGTGSTFQVASPAEILWLVTMRTLFGLRPSKKCAQEVVSHLMSLFPEVERWLEGTIGEHVRMIPVPRLHGRDK
jgi:hypothetical protein